MKQVHNKLVIIRHGESVWNKKNIFTGWTDVGLSADGIKEAKKAGRLLKEQGFVFDIAFTSVLKRAEETLKIVLKEMDQGKIPVKSCWRLNERHYGALQGKNKQAVLKKYGPEQYDIWRRSYNTRPPLLDKKDKRHPLNDPKYDNLPRSVLPSSECLGDTWLRVLPCWKGQILPLIKSSRRILISAHGSTARALLKQLDNISDKEIEKVNVPTGIPLVFEFTENLKLIRHYYLGDSKEVEKAIEKVAREGRV